MKNLLRVAEDLSNGTLTPPERGRRCRAEQSVARFVLRSGMEAGLPSEAKYFHN